MKIVKCLPIHLLVFGAFLAGAVSAVADEGENKPGSKDVATQCVLLEGVFTKFGIDEFCKMALSDHRSSEYPQAEFVCDPADAEACGECNPDEFGNPTAITGKTQGTITLLEPEEEQDPIPFTGKVFCAGTLNGLLLDMISGPSPVDENLDVPWQVFTARTMIMMNLGDDDRDQQPDDAGTLPPKPDVGLFFADVGARTMVGEAPYLTQTMELTGVRRSPNSIKGTLELEGNFFGESEAPIQGTVCGVGLHDAIARMTGYKPGWEDDDDEEEEEEEEEDDDES